MIKGDILMQKKNDERKLEVYNFINDFIKEYGVCPSYDEIASSIGCAKSTLFKYMKRLEEEGYIERYGRNQVVTVENSNSIDRVPVIGSVACGKPKLAIEDIQGYLPINIDWLGRGEYFGLVADGDSMINIGINDGDIVIVRKQSTAENGQVVVALIPDEYGGEMTATLKRFYKERGRYRLQPENDSMKDIYVNRLEILGIAVKNISDVK